MIRKIIIIGLITIVNARDIYVSKTEKYDTDDYLLFDTYNDTIAVSYTHLTLPTKA